MALERLPTEDELPHDDGRPMESGDHRTQMEVLCGSLELAWKDRKDAYIAGNMALYFSAGQIKRNDFLGPDIMIILDTHNRARKSWVVWNEERTPDVVIELLSPTTEANDRGPKMQVYARTLHVSEYYLFDPWDGRFEGYQLHLGRLMYVAMNPEADGGITSARLGLRLVPVEQIVDDEPRRVLRWFTLDGRMLPTGIEAYEAERARSEAERARADALAARLRALGIDPDVA